MSGQRGWPNPTTFEDYLRTTERRLSQEERRSHPIAASDLMGPGMAARAVEIFDWNIEEARFNGFFWSRPGALNTPDPDLAWTGNTIARDDGSGMQQVWNVDEDTGTSYWIRTYVPNAINDGNVIFSAWKRFASGTGLIPPELIDPDLLAQAQQNAQDAIDEAVAEINIGITPTQVYRQPEPPDETSTPPPKEGDVWFDDDAGNATYIYDGTQWVSAVDKDVADAVAAAQAAEQAAVYAQESADGKNKVTYATTPPPPGTPNAIGDTWFQRDASGVIIGHFEGAGGTVWTQRVISGLVLTNLDVGRVTYGELDGQFIKADAINAKHTITGALIQTVATANRGIKFTASALAAYNSSGLNTFFIDGGTGSVFLTGGVFAGGQISGSVVSASGSGRIETETTPNRGIKLNSTGLIAYDSSGNPTLTVLATDGSIAMMGSLTSGSSVTGATITGGIVTGSTVQTSASYPAVRLLPGSFGGSGHSVAFYNANNALAIMQPFVTSGWGGIGGIHVGGGFRVGGPLDAQAITGTSLAIQGGVQIGSSITNAWNITVQNKTTSYDYAGSFITLSETLRARAIYATGQTGTGAAPAEIGAEGLIKRATSSLRFKQDVTPLGYEAEALLALEPVLYRRRDEVNGPVYAGFIAEDAEGLGLSHWLTHDGDGLVDGFHYPAWTAALQAIVRHQAVQISALAARVADLEAG